MRVSILWRLKICSRKRLSVLMSRWRNCPPLTTIISKQVVKWLRKETILKIKIIKCFIILTVVCRSENNSMNSTLISYYNHFNTLSQTKVFVCLLLSQTWLAVWLGSLPRNGGDTYVYIIKFINDLANSLKLQREVHVYICLNVKISYIKLGGIPARKKYYQ